MLPIHKMLARVPNNVCVHKVSRRAFLMQTGVAGGCLVLGVACGDDDDVPEAVGSGPDGGMEGGPDGGMEGGPDGGME
ncbi:MAG: twin-arginine translocation signal domain-containing protein, partial [Myxococcales bacterium]|nr:twin-arginine translocation signal domain-containing protein [Myxococcales bacterium]